MSMNPAIKAEWVAALRNPETKQTTGVLNRVAPGTEDFNRDAPVGFCCLGVLCEIAVEHGVIERDKPDETSGVGGYIDLIRHPDGATSNSSETGILPRLVREWVGLEHCNPTVFAEGSVHALATLNDRKTSFAELADLIEAQL